MRGKTIVIIGLISFVALASCNRKTTGTKEKKEDYKPAIATEAGPPVIIYKTKSDYRELVPVTLSSDKSEVISYPAPGDLYYQGELAYPVDIGDGYLLDIRGINEYTAFLEMTYEEYSSLDEAPDKDKLFEIIFEKDPFVEMYHCGSRYEYQDLVNEMRAKVENGEQKECTRLK